MRMQKEDIAMYVFPEEMRKAYEQSPLSFIYYDVVDGAAVPLLASDGFCRNTGMPRESVLRWLSGGMYERMHPDDVGVTAKISREFMKREGPYDTVFRCRIGKDYQYIHGFGQWQRMPDGKELAVICYLNVTKTKENMVTVAESYDLFRKDQFYSDPLTGVPNLNYLHEFGNERADILRLQNKKPTVVFADVYSMQSYNNQYGVREGDALLRLVAAALKSAFPDALLVRGAIDRFILVTAQESPEALTAGIERANRQIKAEAKGVTSGIRAGICEVGEGQSIIEALDHARHALRRINNDMTRTCAFFSQAADDQYWKERYIIENFDRALENQWIKVYYQGITRVRSQKIASFEALARWVDPIRGIISPADFIPTLQHYHQLYRLDLYMFEQVCREIRIRHENGLALVPVSINFSRQDFDHTDVVARMNELYEKYELSQYVGKDFFIVEITEQDMAMGAERFREQLKRIQDNGYGLWLDDFGSGYSSINMFSQYRFDLIKFDMELLRHLEDNGGVNRIILRELVTVARELGVHTLIEGLEDTDQLGFVEKIGCELAQGFYFHKPAPLDDMLFRLRGGFQAKPCETSEERTEYRKRWTEEGDT